MATPEKREARLQRRRDLAAAGTAEIAEVREARLLQHSTIPIISLWKSFT